MVLLSWWNWNNLYIKSCSVFWLGLAFEPLGASEGSGLNPGKMKQIFNSHVNGVFSVSRDRLDSASLSLVLGLQMPSPPHLLLLLLHDHAWRVTAMFWSSRVTKVANNSVLHFHITQVLASSQKHDCGPLFILFLDSAISQNTSQPQPC